MNLCTCGSGLPKRDLIDARGIFCTYVCDECERDRMGEFRADIFTNAAYEAEEPIDE
jgi:hypothetical protein